MILKGSQRAGAGQLANHLLNDRDNDHVAVVELRGFVADDLHGALAEAQAIAKGTRCKQFLFSLSLNPPKEAVAGEAAFEKAADAAEERLGLTGQPRAIIIHEKEGRRHAHVVWSRIDAASMRAVNMAHFKTKLTALSKELYLEHGWQLPDGLRHMGGKSPLNFSLAEWQQAKRLGLDPREIKQTFQEAWRQADSLKAFAAALEERGYFLAKGDRRGVVAVDINGDVFSVPKFAGVRTSAFRDRFGEGRTLPPVAEVSAELRRKVTAQLRAYQQDAKEAQREELRPLLARRDEVVAAHRTQRERLSERQAALWEAETQVRAKRLRTGLAGVWDAISGRAAAIRKDNEREAIDGLRRDRLQRDDLAREQMAERGKIQERLNKLRLRHIAERKALNRELVQLLAVPPPEQDAARTRRARRRGPSLDI